jgi:alanine-glyoxylate transaminase/serine-glyoxylate transaminase/serine-pyruvate transaminase
MATIARIPARLLLGPGPSPVSDRVMRAMSAPVLSHLDPAMVEILDGVRARLRRLFQTADEGFTFAVSGTGTSGMDAAVANLTRPGARAIAIVTGYFGERLAQMLERRGASLSRVDVEWGRACDPSQLERALTSGADVVAMVHAETSTGVLNPVAELCGLAASRGAMTIVDAVTSLGAQPVDAAGWRADAVYSCTQKGLGAPSGLAPITFSRRAREFRATLGSGSDAPPFYLDLALLEDYWLRRKYHHTISAPLVYALQEALASVEEEGLEARWKRHQDVHRAFVKGLRDLDLHLLPPEGERLWSLNAVVVPDGVDEARLRRRLLDDFQIEIGAGLGPLAGKIWRVGLMGSGATRENVDRLLTAFRTVLHRT